MANDYYNNSLDFVPETPVRSAQLDAQFDAIEAGFDLLSGQSELAAGAQIYGGVDTGTEDNYLAETGDGTDSTFIDGQMLSFIPSAANTGASVISVNSSDNVSVVRNDGNPLQANDLLAGVPVMMIYDDTNTRWVLVGSTAEQSREGLRPGVKTIATNYTLTAEDENYLILANSASAINVTLPANATEALPTGFLCHVYQDGAGTLTLVADTGVTIEYAVGLEARLQESSLSVIKTDTNAYKVVGDQAAP